MNKHFKTSWNENTIQTNLDMSNWLKLWNEISIVNLICHYHTLHLIIDFGDVIWLLVPLYNYAQPENIVKGRDWIKKVFNI